MKEFSIETGLNMKDYRKLAYWNVFGKDKKTLFGILLMGASGTLCVIFGRENGMIFAIGTALLLCPFLALAVAEAGIFRARRSGAVETLTRGTYTFMEKGVEVLQKSTGDRVFYDYAHMGNIYETPEYFILFVNKIQMLAIARRDLKQGEEKRVKEALHKGKFGK